MLEWLSRFKNTGTVISTVSLIGLLVAQFGVQVDQTWLLDTVKIVCSLGVVLGIMNNPTSSGVDLPIGNNKENKE